VERMHLNPLPNETSLNPAVPANQLCPISDLNELPAEQKNNARASELATDGFVPSTLQKREQFLRQAFQHLRDSSYPKSHQVRPRASANFVLEDIDPTRSAWKAGICSEIARTCRASTSSRAARIGVNID
jgi:hypothetical protein